MHNLEELLMHELRDIYHAEGQLVKALPKMAKAAKNAELRTAFQEHTEQTKGQVERLKQCFEQMGNRVKGEPCEGMQGLIQEAQELMQEDAEDVVKDLGLLGAADKVEHYEISSYEGAVMMARMMGLNQVADLLQQNLAEEQETAKRMQRMVKPMMKEAASLGHEDEEMEGEEMEEEEEEV
ncbi:MAG: ferritin-like domain-containing protein [Bryobacteraceae bacterium]|nr:ferritin-like domain-containing protein [Bryobacteraceae bacterium]